MPYYNHTIGMNEFIEKYLLSILKHYITGDKNYICTGDKNYILEFLTKVCFI